MAMWVQIPVEPTFLNIEREFVICHSKDPVFGKSNQPILVHFNAIQKVFHHMFQYLIYCMFNQLGIKKVVGISAR